MCRAHAGSRATNNRPNLPRPQALTAWCHKFPAVRPVPGILPRAPASLVVMPAPFTATAVAPPLPDAAHLPDEPALLKQMIAELLTTLHGRARECEQLRHRLDQLLRRLYG